ncbi:MAG: hypothetical protein D6717_02400 [Gammaproteobacteria bacterium]|nr:MAG: hypothetical protein D6717_02400 [Gammaproteobacteria bacterium]
MYVGQVVCLALSASIALRAMAATRAAVRHPGPLAGSRAFAGREAVLRCVARLTQLSYGRMTFCFDRPVSCRRKRRKDYHFPARAATAARAPAGCTAVVLTAGQGRVNVPLSAEEADAG